MNKPTIARKMAGRKTAAEKKPAPAARKAVTSGAVAARPAAAAGAGSRPAAATASRPASSAGAASRPASSAGARPAPTAKKRAPSAGAEAVVPAIAPAPKAEPKPQATIETTAGPITVELWPEKAPKHVENFVKIAERGQYDNLIFHQVIPGFMILTGCPKGDGTGGPGWKVPAEFNDARFVKGTVGMARGAHRDSAGSQFFICVGDAPHLNGSYTAFGKVVAGQDVAEKISQIPRDKRGRPLQDMRMVRVAVKTAKG